MMIQITGNTYPVREQLKALGGRYDGRLHVWWVPQAQQWYQTSTLTP